MRQYLLLLPFLILPFLCSSQKTKAKAKQIPPKVTAGAEPAASAGEKPKDDKKTAAVSSDSARHLLFKSLVSALNALEILSDKKIKTTPPETADETSISGYIERKETNEVLLFSGKDTPYTNKKIVSTHKNKASDKEDDKPAASQLNPDATKATVTIDRVDITIEANQVTRIQLFSGKNLVGYSTAKINLNDLNGDTLIPVKKDDKNLFIRIGDLLQFTWRHDPKNLHDLTYVLSDEDPKITLKNQ